MPADVKTLADFLCWARTNPDKADYGIPAAGSALHFAGMMLERASGMPLKSIPYRGGAPPVQDLLGGEIPAAFNVVSEVLPHVRADRLRSLAVGSAQRWAALPEVPSFTELGYKDIVIVEFLGWYAPARTAPELVRGLNAAIQDALGSPEMQEVFNRNGLVAPRQTPEAFAAHVKDELNRWGPIVKASGMFMDLNTRAVLAPLTKWNAVVHDARRLPERVRRVRAEHGSRLVAMAADSASPMHPAAIAQAVGAALPDDALVVYDGGHTSFWSNDLTPVHTVRTRFHDPGMSQLGFGLGTALDGTDYAAIARGFGCHGESVDATAQIPAALERARASGLPAVIDCRTRFVPHPCAPAFGSMHRCGWDALTRTPLV